MSFYTDEAREQAPRTSGNLQKQGANSCPILGNIKSTGYRDKTFRHVCKRPESQVQ